MRFHLSYRKHLPERITKNASTEISHSHRKRILIPTGALQRLFRIMRTRYVNEGQLSKDFLFANEPDCSGTIANEVVRRCGEVNGDAIGNRAVLPHSWPHVVRSRRPVADCKKIFLFPFAIARHPHIRQLTIFSRCPPEERGVVVEGLLRDEAVSVKR